MFLRLLGLAAWVVVTLWLHTNVAIASEAGAHFAQGVEHAEHGQWESAASAFEKALALEDRPGVRFNLVLAYRELERPLDVVRHALAFLALPAEPHRAQARTEVEQALSRAEGKLARVNTGGWPAGTRLTIDGVEPLRDERHAYVMPGTHRLERSLEGASAIERVELILRAGEMRDWPAPTPVVPVLPAVALPETPLQAPLAPAGPAPRDSQLSLYAAQESRLRKRLAWSLGTIGAIGLSLGLASYGASLRAAEGIRNSDPYMPGSGLWDGSVDYTRWVNCVGPLSIAGSALMSAAVTVGDHTTDQRSSVWAWGALSAGVAIAATGVVMVAQKPDLIDNSGLPGPSRQAGVMLLGAALPLLTYAVTYAVRHGFGERSRAQTVANSLRARR